jgi:probable phosphomutase (TIGR03848 family)
MAKRTAPRPTLVLLVRHGLTSTTGKRLPGQEPGLHLSDKGLAMADRTAERVAAVPGIQAVYASSLERAQETARPIAKAVGLRVRTDAGLVDSDTGDWTGRYLSQLRKKPEWRTIVHAPSSFRFPGGESFVETHARLDRTIEKLRKRHEGEAIVAVSHADPIKLVVAQALGMHLDHFQRLVIAPCSVSAIVYNAGAPTVLAVNFTGDLGSLLG